MKHKVERAERVKSQRRVAKRWRDKGSIKEIRDDREGKEENNIHLKMAL